MGKELENEPEQKEKNSGRTKGSPAANTFRRRSVRTYCPGRVATTTTSTTTTTPRPTRTSDPPGIPAATVATVATEAEDDCSIIADGFMRESISASELRMNLACSLYDFSAHLYKSFYRDNQLH